MRHFSVLCEQVLPERILFRAIPIFALIILVVYSARPAGGQTTDPLEPPAAANAAETPADPKPTSAEERIEAALRLLMRFEAIEDPLVNVAERLSKMFKIPIYVDRRALQDVGFDTATPITCNFDGITLRSALNLMLKEFDLTYIIKNETLIITTPEEAETNPQTRIYPVTDLVRFESEDGKFSVDTYPLTEIIFCTIEPATWDCGSGPDPIDVLRLPSGIAIVVSQTREVHEQIVSLLRMLRKVNESNASADGAPVAAIPSTGLQHLTASDDPRTRKAERRIEAALGSLAQFDAIEQPLSDLMEQLSESYGIPIFIDRRALRDVGTDPSTPVTCDFDGITLRSTLDIMLKEIELTYIIENEVLMITTPEEAEEQLLIYVYPVTDLVRLETEDGKFFVDFDSLVHIITKNVTPRTWAEAGGPGSIVALPLPGGIVMVVSQTRDGHEQVSSLLRAIRKTNEAEKGHAPYYHREPVKQEEPSPPRKAANYGSQMIKGNHQGGGLF